MATRGTVGKMFERIVIEESAPDPIAVASLTRTLTTATASTAPTAHGFQNGDYVQVAGANEAAYNAAKVKVTVLSATSFSYQVSGSPSSPATGTITVTYLSDAQGNRKLSWSELVALPAEAMAISATERLAAAAIPALASSTLYRFRTHLRPDVTDDMRVRWTPRYPEGAPEQVLEITGVLREDSRFMVLDCVD
jgi:head-tail adaptor